jgi:hypothetical protein
MQDEQEQVRLLREIQQDLARLTKIEEKAARHSRGYYQQFERNKFARRTAIILLIAIVLLLLIQILQGMGYGPGGGTDNNNPQTLQRVHAIN